MSKLPPYAAAWAAQWKNGEAARARVRDEELATLSDDQARRQSDALLAMGAEAFRRDPENPRWATSGFTIQQALFAKARRR